VGFFLFRFSRSSHVVDAFELSLFSTSTTSAFKTAAKKWSPSTFSRPRSSLAPCSPRRRSSRSTQMSECSARSSALPWWQAGQMPKHQPPNKPMPSLERCTSRAGKEPFFVSSFSLHETGSGLAIVAGSV
jgi:hypothetical protein